MLNRKDPFAQRDAAAAAQAARPEVRTRTALQPVVSSNGITDGYRNAKVPITSPTAPAAPTLARKDPAMPVEQRAEVLERMTKPGPTMMTPQELATFGMPRRKPKPSPLLSTATEPATPSYAGLGSPDWTLSILGDFDGN